MMKNRFKVVIFAMVMSAIMLVTSMSVFAKTISEEVALSGVMGEATIYIETGSALVAWARTSGASSSNEIAHTRIYGGGPTPHSNTGWNYAEVSASAHAFTYAESEHIWTGRHWSLTIFP